MNKKFFTLIASVFMLAASLGTVSGQVIPKGSIPTTLNPTATSKYQIAVTTLADFNTAAGISGTSTPGLSANQAAYQAWFNTGATDVTLATGADKILTALQTSSSSWTNAGGRALQYVWIDKAGVLRTSADNNFTTGEYFESIFCVNYTKATDGGQTSTLGVRSWANGFFIEVAHSQSVPTYNPVTSTTPYNPAGPATAINVGGGNIRNWGYSFGYKSGELQHWMPLYAYMEGSRDSVYIFAYNENGNPARHIRLERWSATKLSSGILPDNALLFEFVVPKERVLNASDYNTKLGYSTKAGSQKLTFQAGTQSFVPSDGKAPWKDQALTAIDVTSPYQRNAPGNWLYFKAAEGDNKGKFLYLDTAYYDKSTDVLKFNWSNDTLSAYKGRTNTTLISQLRDKDRQWVFDADNNPVMGVDTSYLYNGAIAPASVSSFINQYRFQVTYFWENDSIAIDIAEANLKTQTNTAKFYQLAPKRWIVPQAYTSNSAWETAKVNGNGTPAGAVDADYLHVKLFGLETDESRVLSVGDRNVRTRIKFGMSGCDFNTISIDEGVYVIRNASGSRALWVPIYSRYDAPYLNLETNGNGLPYSAAMWVTPEKAVDPARLPAYQWIVKKTNASDPAHSPVTIINREYPMVRFENVRIMAGDSLVLRFANYDTEDEFEEKVAPVKGVGKSFEPVPATFKTRWTGYFHVDTSTAKTSRFDLNYYNNLIDLYGGAQIFFMDKSKDTTVVIDKARTLEFTFKPQGKTPVRYGYVPTKAEVTSLGIDTLMRFSYQLVTKVVENGRSVEKMLRINDEDRYYLDSTNVGRGDSAIFLLKAQYYATTNDGLKDDFYALLDTNSISTVRTDKYAYNTSSVSADQRRVTNFTKVAIPTGGVQILGSDQLARETHTFAVTRHTPPLYRRFDGSKEYKAYQNEKVAAPEPFGNSTDAPVALKFTRQNNYGYEFLGENSPAGLGNNNKGGVGSAYDDDSAKWTTVNDYRQGLSAYGQKNTSFLGYYNRMQYPEKDGRLSYTFYVDTAYSRRPAMGANAGYTSKPQYMLAIRAQYFKKDTLVYKGDGQWTRPDGTVVSVDPEKRDTIYMPAFTTGWYLYNAQDSVNVERGYDDFLGKYGYGGQGTTRLAFVRGIHIADSFYVIPNEKEFNKMSAIDLVSERGKYLRTLPAHLIHYLGENTHYETRYANKGKGDFDYADAGKKTLKNGKAMVFQFRLVPDEFGDRRFMIETQTADAHEQYGPDIARWVRFENGVPFITGAISFQEAIESTHNGADIFNVVDGGSIASATSAEAAYVNGAQVIGNAGSVSVLNAAGKTVTVTNVLGQTIAKTVVSSDNATIVLPKGIVVVSVDGKSTKAVVK